MKIKPKTRSRHEWTKQHISYLKILPLDITDKVWSEKINEKFGLDLSQHQVKIQRTKLGIMKGSGSIPDSGQFAKGNKPWNYGVATGIVTSGAAVKGDVRASVANGTERDKAGYTQIKTAYPNTWEYKHRLVWEEENGEVPEGHVIIFGDKDKRNFNVDNLICMSRAELVRMGCGNLIQEDAELTRTMLNVVKIDSKIAELKKGD